MFLLSAGRAGGEREGGVSQRVIEMQEPASRLSRGVLHGVERAL